VAHSLFLDGSTFRAGPQVEKRPFVAQAELGAGVRVRHFGLEYGAVFRGREYETQESPHSWGTISLLLSP
jgi:hypothetical protein